MKLFYFLNRWLEEIMITVFGTVMVLCLSFAAIARYIPIKTSMSKSSHMAEELAVFCFVGLLYMGAVLATREGRHFRVSAQFFFLPKRLQKWRFLPGDIIWLSFNLFVVWQGIELIIKTMAHRELSVSLGVPMQYIYTIIPIAFGLTAFRLIQSYINGAQGIEENDELNGLKEAE